MRISFFVSLTLFVVATSAYNSVEFLSNDPICGSFYDLTKTFPNALEFSKEYIASGKTWKIVSLGTCPSTSECKVYNPVCGVSPANKYQTFMNACLMEADRKLTGTGWEVVKSGSCSANSLEHSSLFKFTTTEGYSKTTEKPETPLTLASAKAVLKYIAALSKTVKDASKKNETAAASQESSDFSSLLDVKSTEAATPSTTKAPTKINMFHAESLGEQQTTTSDFGPHSVQSSPANNFYEHLRQMYLPSSPSDGLYSQLPISPIFYSSVPSQPFPDESSKVKRHITEEVETLDEKSSNLAKRGVTYTYSPSGSYATHTSTSYGQPAHVQVTYASNSYGQPGQAQVSYTPSSSSYSSNSYSKPVQTSYSPSSSQTYTPSSSSYSSNSYNKPVQTSYSPSGSYSSYASTSYNQQGQNPINFEISLSYPAGQSNTYGYGNNGYGNTAAAAANSVPWQQLGQLIASLGIKTNPATSYSSYGNSNTNSYSKPSSYQMPSNSTGSSYSHSMNSSYQMPSNSTAMPTNSTGSAYSYTGGSYNYGGSAYYTTEMPANSTQTTTSTTTTASTTSTTTTTRSTYNSGNSYYTTGSSYNKTGMTSNSTGSYNSTGGTYGAQYQVEIKPCDAPPLIIKYPQPKPYYSSSYSSYQPITPVQQSAYTSYSSYVPQESSYSYSYPEYGQQYSQIYHGPPIYSIPSVGNAMVGAYSSVHY
uniref:Kazal-like domain-containing protein n=1 Tax=Stomoxys calcitrans TaxID=35570 RepID=A0A1I8Q3S1_STOCA